ncbi:MAG: hypothetical protein H6741_13345 [Alphaproteobacteria bacterium]|nr:hypothetical protein [Alphaproteobacteria bacterium]MCB9793701.1 hypothetical protein [Alphaproteobacteria bacterium]
MPATLLLLLLSGAARAELGGGYLGEAVTHPGALLRWETPLQARGPHQLRVGAELGAYWHPRSHVGTFVDARVGWRRSTGAGYSPQLSLGLGYLHAFVAAEAANFSNTGRPALMPVLDLGVFGWELDLGGPARLGLDLRVFGQYPVNHHRVVHPALVLTFSRAAEAS